MLLGAGWHFALGVGLPYNRKQAENCRSPVDSLGISTIFYRDSSRAKTQLIYSSYLPSLPTLPTLPSMPSSDILINPHTSLDILRHPQTPLDNIIILQSLRVRHLQESLEMINPQLPSDILKYYHKSSDITVIFAYF